MTVLYKKDYVRNSPHINLRTTNKSFLRISYILKRMGIENNMFPLYLNDLDLRGIDPHKLGSDDMHLCMKVAYECKVNPWYYFREVIRIPETGTQHGIKFKLSRANLALIWLYFLNVDHTLIMPRQLGKTVGTISIDSWLMFIGGNNINKVMLTKSNKLRKENVSRLKGIRDLLPSYLVNETIEDVNNVEELTYATLNTRYTTFVSQSGATAAESLGRGLTTPTQHWDEVAFFDNIAISYPSAINSTNAARESAMKFGQPYANILTTTAGRLDTDSGKFIFNLICQALTFSEHLYDAKDREALIKLIDANSPIGMVFSEFSYEQLGKNKEWFDMVSKRSSGTAESIKMDFLNTWVHGSANSAIDDIMLSSIHKSKREIEYRQTIGDFIIDWYLPKSVACTSRLDSIPIIIGSDSSENIGKDFASFVFMDVRDMSVIAKCRCNTVNLITMALFIYKFIRRENIVFIPERNHVGAAIIDAILLECGKENINPFTRIYNEVVQGLKEDKFKDANIHEPGAVNKYRKYFGFKTTGSSRSFLYKTVFFKALDLCKDKLHDTDLIHEIKGLTIRNGRIDHASSGHDDLVIGFVLCSYLLMFGENLNKYSFCNNDASIVMSHITTSAKSEEATSTTLIDILTIKNKLREFKAKLKSETNATMKLRMQFRINELEKMLPDEVVIEIDDVSSINQLRRTTTNDIETIDKFATHDKQTQLIGMLSE